MQFVKPIPFQEAIDLIGDRSAIGAQLSSSEWADVPVALRDRAFFSSNVENVRFLQRAQDSLGDFLAANKTTLPDGQTMLATGGRAAFIEQLRTLAIAEGMGPLDEKDAGGLKDIRSERRLGLIFDTQTRQGGDYGYWRQGMDPDVLNEFPAQRFIRVIDVKEPRTSHIQYENQVYLKTDPIWARRINQDFGVPWGPWAWGCGHDTEDVDRKETESLGLLQPGQQLKPDVKNFNENLKASTRGLAPELIEKMKQVFGKRVTFKGQKMVWNPHVPAPRPIPQPGQSVLAEALKVEEADLAERRGTEKIVVLEPDGSIVLQREGTNNAVKVSAKDKPYLEDAILTHNHPLGLSFSVYDVRASVKFNLAELRAVGVRAPYTYTLKRPDQGWPAQLPLRYEAVFNDLQTKYLARLLRGEMTEDEAMRELTHEVMLNLADEMDLDYERIQRD